MNLHIRQHGHSSRSAQLPPTLTGARAE